MSVSRPSLCIGIVCVCTSSGSSLLSYQYRLSTTQFCTSRFPSQGVWTTQFLHTFLLVSAVYCDQVPYCLVGWSVAGLLCKPYAHV